MNNVIIDILTTEQVAERLQMSVHQVRDLVRSKVLPVIRLNQRVWRFHWPTELWKSTPEEAEKELARLKDD